MSFLVTNNFVREYKIPLVGTTLFIVIMLILLALRVYQDQSLSTLLQNKASNSQDYAQLLSNDKVHSVNNTIQVATNTTQSTPTSSTKSTVVTSHQASTGSTGSNNSSGGSNTSGGNTGSNGGSNESSKPFADTVFGVHQNGPPSGSCSGSTCSETIPVAADVGTKNGPGTVDYTWCYAENVPSSDACPSNSSSGSFQAPTGDSGNSETTSITITCNQGSTAGGTLAIEFMTSSPSTSSQSTFVPSC